MSTLMASARIVMAGGYHAQAPSSPQCWSCSVSGSRHLGVARGTYLQQQLCGRKDWQPLGFFTKKTGGFTAEILGLCQ